MLEILRRPGNLVLSLGVTVLLSLFATPADVESGSLPIAVAGRLFLLVTGISGLFGYSLSGSRHANAETPSDEIVSLRGFVLGHVVSASALATSLTWIAVGVMLIATVIRHGGSIGLDPWMLAYAACGPWLVSAAFAGAMALARHLLRRGGRMVVAWTLFLPWMLTFAAFRLLGGLPGDPSRIVALSLLSAVALCAVEMVIFLRFVPNRLTMRPR
jgi:hypothetical protein